MTISSTPIAGLAGRWGLAAALSTAVLAASIGAVAGSYLVNLRSAVPSVAADHVPADAPIYAEMRLDLPGDQRAMFAELLDRFPGVDAERWMEHELGTLLDEVLTEARTGQSYSRDVAPWFDGRLAFAFLSLPSSHDPFAPVVPEMIVFMGLTDVEAATRFTDRMRADLEADGTSFRSTNRHATTIWASNFGLAYAVTDRFVLFGMDEADLRRSLDVAAGGAAALADRSEFTRLVARLPAERMMLATLDMATLAELSIADLKATAPEMADAYRALVADQPGFAVMTGRFEGDRVEFIVVSDAPTGDLATENTTRDLASRVPGDAFLFADGSKVGESFEHALIGMKAGMASAPEGQLMLAEIEQFELAFNTSLEDLLAWAGDGAVVAGWDGTEFYGGVLLEATDRTAAAQLLERLSAMIGLARSDPAVADFVVIRTATVVGAEVTTVVVAVPPEVGLGLEGLSLEYVEHDGMVLLGFGQRFVRHVLELDEVDSLGRSARFRDAIDTVNGNESVGVFFIDLSAVREAVEAALAEELAGGDYERHVQPYLRPFSHLVGSGRVEGDNVESIMLLVLE